MMTENTMENLKVGSPTIKAMFAELAQLDADLHTATNDIEIQKALERHWAVREPIAATPMFNLHDALWMARTAKLEEKRDPGFTNDAPGSAAHLASLAVSGLIRFAAGAA